MDKETQEKAQKDIGAFIAEYSCNPEDYSLVETVRELMSLALPKDKPPLLSNNPYAEDGRLSNLANREAKEMAYEAGKESQREADIKHYEEI